MRPRRITDADLALAYEYKCEYGWTYERIAKEVIRCSRSYLTTRINEKIRGIA